MFVFKKEQEVCDFGGIKIGGNPGENPTVLIGGLFFKGQPIVEDTKQGQFDKELAKEWIETGKEMSKKTGHPFIVQAFGRTATAMERHLEWLVENYDGPFIFESTSAKTRMKAIQYCDEAGLKERAIYNSVNLSLKNDEKEILKASSFENAIVLGWSPKAMSLPERMNVIKEMITEAEHLGIHNMVIDPATMPVGSGFGLEFRTTLAVKSELGLPTCLAPHNAPSAWRFIKRKNLDNEPTYLSAVVASTVAAQLFATDCIMYGSMVRTKEVFAATALISNAISSAMAEAQRVLGIDRELFYPITQD
ncbi:MAG: tetrahydromethanopterin S-methyltransferase subunit H [Candidatus Thorarchaeota archaeon]